MDRRSDEVTWAPNELGGVGGISPCGPGGEQTWAALPVVRDAVAAAPLPKERLAPREAVPALLRAGARCGDSECAGNIAPFGSAPVSLPSRDLVGVNIYKVSPRAASHMFTRLRDTILFSDEEYALRIKNEGLPNLHFDPVLEAHPAMWEGLWRELRDGGLDYFHELRIDKELSQHFALPPVRASAAEPDEFIYPALRWSSHGAPPPVLDVGAAHLAYVDNFGVVGSDEKEVRELHRQALTGARQAGWQVHGVEQVSTSMDIVGRHFDGQRQVVAWRFYAGLHAPVRRSRCTGRETWALRGHLCFAFLLWRPCQSRLVAPAFAESAGEGAQSIWHSVKRKLLIAAAIRCLVYAGLGPGWLDQVVATDASQTCLGARAAEWAPATRAEGSIRIRTASIARCLVDRGGNLVYDGGGHAWLSYDDFPDMQTFAATEAKWAVVAKRPCGGHEGAILVKEARGVKLGFQYIVRCGRWRHSKVLMLVDNAGLVLALQKGRCRGPALHGQLRQTAALQLATGLRAQRRWIPSEAPGGGGSAASWETGLARLGAAAAERAQGQDYPNYLVSRWLAEIASHNFDEAGCRSVLSQPRGHLDYSWRVEDFLESARRHDLRVTTLDCLGEALLEWADQAYLDGRKKHDGEKLEAAVLHFDPNLKRPNTKPLARFERSLKARGRRRPALGRLPPPYPTVCGLAMAPHLMGRTDVAVAVLNWSLIFGPLDDNGDPTKTGVCDDNATLDHDNLQFLGYFFEQNRSGKQPEDQLWAFSQAELGKLIAKAVKFCHLEKIGIVSYRLRHAGPSWDVITGRRSQLEVQRRGRWASISPLIRCEKSSKVDAMLVELPPDAQEYLRLCCSHLGDSSSAGSEDPDRLAGKRWVREKDEISRRRGPALRFAEFAAGEIWTSLTIMDGGGAAAPGGALIVEGVLHFVGPPLKMMVRPDFRIITGPGPVSYSVDPEVRALPLKLGELESSLPDASAAGELKATACVSESIRLAAHMVKLGILARIDDASRVFTVDGAPVAQGAFAVSKKGKPGNEQARITLFIVTMIPTNSYLKAICEDLGTLTPQGRRFWSSDDQKGAFFLWEAPEAWQAYVVPGEKVPGHMVWAPERAWTHGLAPGQCRPPWCDDPAFDQRGPDGGDPAGGCLAKHYLAVSGKGGCNMRLDVGAPHRVRAWPRAAVQVQSRRWKVALSYVRQGREDGRIKFFGAGGRPQFDQVEIAKEPEDARAVRQWSALCLACQFYPMGVHAATDDNPADLPCCRNAL
ncbi:unnamed protein product [Prorocentrum cordatum]|uniref:RNA-dependent RNA polymerase n=1 Tax=Prorocentrum cordatum TaxID=2364126 RepID=A0ABN9VGE2_9DINO|nr:unnamed protein product [Polarella glacialis]